MAKNRVPDLSENVSPGHRVVPLRILRALVEGETLTARIVQQRYGWSKPGDARSVLKLIADEFPWVRVRERADRTLEFVSDLTRDGLAAAPRTQSAPSTWFELLALQACRGLLRLAADTELRRAIDAQLQRALDAANHGPVPDLSRVFRAVWRAPERISHSPEDVDELLSGIVHQRRVRFHYETYDGRPDDLEFEPWTLVLSTDGLHVYGRVRDSSDEERIGQCRLLACSRIRNVTRQQAGFLLPERDEYDPDRLWEHCFGLHLPPMVEDDDGELRMPEPQPVRFEVHPRHGHFLRTRPLHPKVRVAKTTTDGWIVVAGVLHPTLDLVAYLRGLGPDVRNIEPPELARAVGRWVHDEI